MKAIATSDRQVDFEIGDRLIGLRHELESLTAENLALRGDLAELRSEITLTRQGILGRPVPTRSTALRTSHEGDLDGLHSN